MSHSQGGKESEGRLATMHEVDDTNEGEGYNRRTGTSVDRRSREMSSPQSDDAASHQRDMLRVYNCNGSH
jgi:hypothetical protein